MSSVQKVSVHGGHSGQYCNHASDTLEDIIVAYIHNGYTWIGITEHIPPSSDDFLYPEEIDAGLNAKSMYQRFTGYIHECRKLQQKYKKDIEIFVGMEIETYRGYEDFVDSLLHKFRPDYMVGSIHHVDDMPIDYSKELYDRAAHELGSLDALYCRYFDQQYAMLEKFKPAVVGHFDLIRIFDPEYQERFKNSEIISRIIRNLEVVQHNNLILDCNIRSLLKGANEPYVSKSILELARQRDIAVVPGDDSHGVDSIGINFDRAVSHLVDAGFSTQWQKPRLYSEI